MGGRVAIPSGVEAVRAAQAEPERSLYMSTRSEAAGHIVKGQGLPEDIVVAPPSELLERFQPESSRDGQHATQPACSSQCAEQAQPCSLRCASTPQTQCSKFYVHLATRCAVEEIRTGLRSMLQHLALLGRHRAQSCARVIVPDA